MRSRAVQLRVTPTATSRPGTTTSRPWTATQATAHLNTEDARSDLVSANLDLISRTAPEYSWTSTERTPIPAAQPGVARQNAAKPTTLPPGSRT